jgi:CBS domain-containing protein
MNDISNLTVQEFTSPFVVTVKKDDSLDRAFDIMQECGIRHLPVMEAAKVEGIISERDLLMHIGKDWSKMMKVEDVMNTSLLAAYETDLLGDVAYQLSSEKKGSAIILDKEGNLTGIFTTTDALNALVEILYPQAREKSELKNFL